MRPSKYKKKQDSVERLRLVHETGLCPVCESALEFISTDNRELTDLSGKRALSIGVYRCVDSGCSCHHGRIKPTSYLNRIVPYSGYGIDVYAQVSYWRLVDKHSVPEIHQRLLERYPHIEIGERHVENLINTVGLCLSVQHEDSGYLRAYFESCNLSQLCLSVDGIEPEKGHAILYVVRETQSGKVFYARWCEHSDTASLVQDFFEPLKVLLDQIGIALGAWIVDKQHALAAGIAVVFADTPIQNCQSHFLASVKQEVLAEDRSLGKEIKKKFRGLKAIEKTIDSRMDKEQLSQHQHQALQGLCLIPRGWISRSLSHKHHYQGVKLYEDIQQTVQTIEALRKEQEDVSLQALEELLKQSLDGQQTRYEAINKVKGFTDELTGLLYGPTDADGQRHSALYRKRVEPSWVKQQVEQLLLQTHEQHKQHSPLMRKLLRHQARTYHNWKDKLFTCYQYDFIPNDNNALELSHSRLKRLHRRMSGQKSSNRFLKKHGHYLALSSDYTQVATTPKQFADLIQQTDFNKVLQHKKKEKHKSAKQGFLYTAKRKVAKVLDKITNLWKVDSS